MKTIILSALAFALAPLLTAHAQIIVNFDAPGGLSSSNYGGAPGGSGAPGADTGGVTNEYWNPIGSSGDLASNGTTHTGITFTNTIGGSFANPSLIALFSPYLDGGGAGGQTETLNNVSAGTYDVYIYSQNGAFADRGGEFTLGSTTQFVSNNGDQSTFIEGTNYTEFTNVKLTATGSISFTLDAWHGVADATNFEADFNGVQLVELPEPTTWAMLFGGMGLLLVVQRLRGKLSL
jgi:hypothetical protein